MRLPIQRHDYTPYNASKQWTDNIDFDDQTFCIACGDSTIYGNKHPFCPHCMITGNPNSPLCCHDDQRLCRYGALMTCRSLLTYSIEVQDTLLRLQSGLELRPVIVMRSVSLSRSVPVPLPIPPLGDVPSAPVGAESQAPELAPVRDVTPPPENWGYDIPNLTKLPPKPRK